MTKTDNFSKITNWAKVVTLKGFSTKDPMVENFVITQGFTLRVKVLNVGIGRKTISLSIDKFLFG